MRKHRRYGVVIAVLLGLGGLTQRPSFAHHAAGTDFGRSSFQIKLAESSAGHDYARRQATAHELSFDKASPSGTVLPGSTAPGEAAVVALTSFVPPPPPPPPPPPAPPVVVRTVVAPVVAAKAAPPPAAVDMSDVWARLRFCESRGNYNDNTGNGYYGAYQFALGTWESLGLTGLPSDAPPAEQDAAAQELQARRGWGQWPVCSRKLGL